jgi:hypothetical protein
MESIIIGNQECSSTNISEILFSNGDIIPVAYDLNEWLEYFESGKPCYRFILLLVVYGTIVKHWACRSDW